MKQIRPIPSRTRVSLWQSVLGMTDCQSVLLWLRRYCTCIFALFLIQVVVSSVYAEAADEKPEGNEPKLARTPQAAR